uniref:Amidase domain-containing protein n=1 Tax=Bionectria ochroleuca TaxID=29856 RepID=A0A8H7K2H6_BIOOC
MPPSFSRMVTWPMQNVLGLAMGTSLAMHTSTSFQVGQVEYLGRLLLGVSAWAPDWKHASAPEPPVLVTCFRLQTNQIIDAGTLNAWRNHQLDHDDVFHPAFLERVIFNSVESDQVTLTDDAKQVLKDWNTTKVDFSPHLNLTSGPYYLDRGVFHSVWRVFEDPQLAFLEAIWPLEGNPCEYTNQPYLPSHDILLAHHHSLSSFTRVSAAGNGYRSHGIAVPSRSYTQAFTPSGSGLTDNETQSALRGLRIAVKDNYHIQGIKTSLGNRAYFNLYPTQNATAKVVSKLIDQGAHIVGKAHLSSFAMMEHPTQSVDYQAPFNPRGDGYLITGGSSGGSAAATAAYEWIDIAICSDTTGSSRIPALQTGVFGFRPSTGSISGEGMVNAWAAFDTPAWFGRNLELFPNVLGALTGLPVDKSAAAKPPSAILYPTDFAPADSPDQIEAMERLLEDLATASDCNYTRVSIENDWAETGPTEERSLYQYLYNVTHNGWHYSAFHSFDQFREQYESRYGHIPFVTEVIR